MTSTRVPKSSYVPRGGEGDDTVARLGVYGFLACWTAPFASYEAMHVYGMAAYHADPAVKASIMNKQLVCSNLGGNLAAVRVHTLDRQSIDGLLDQAQECYATVGASARLQGRNARLHATGQGEYATTAARELRIMSAEVRTIQDNLSRLTAPGIIDAVYLAPTIVFTVCATRAARHLRCLWPTIKEYATQFFPRHSTRTPRMPFRPS